VFPAAPMIELRPVRALRAIRIAVLSLLSIPVVLVWTSCQAKGVEELARQELFTLAIGKMDNQIDLFQIEGTRYGETTRIAMRDGLFYVANGNSQKVMGFSSYGDLIFLLYNPDTNPPPVSFSQGSEDEVASTKVAVAYPFRRLGELAVDSDKRLYVEDMVAQERQVRDRELKVILDRVVLRFDRHGEQLDFIGQEGVGGTPFPYVEDLCVTERDELVVICRAPQFWQVFWYSKEGSLRYQVTVDQDHLPLPDGGGGAIASVGRLVPDLTSDTLNVLVYYYTGAADDPNANPEESLSYSARIYKLDLGSGRYDRYVEVPQDGTRKERVGAQEVEIPAPSYELLGTNAGGYYFLLRREDANLFQLLILEPGGRELTRRHLVMEDSELYYKQVGLAATGIVYALLAEEYAAKVVWWRSDRLAREAIHENR
jgi:hypothetical protein